MKRSSSQRSSSQRSSSQRSSNQRPSDQGAAVTVTATPGTKRVVGWREYVGLPDIGVERIKAKVDTGARTSALHAFNIEFVTRHGAKWVRFDVHPRQRSAKQVVTCEAPLAEERHVTDSGGRRTLRPVIVTTVALAGERMSVELTLIARDEMGFRMLLGRQAIRGRFLVDSGRSYLIGKRKKKKKKKTKKTKSKGTP